MATVIREVRVGAHELICEQTYSPRFRKLKDSEGCCTDGQSGQLPTASSWQTCSSHQHNKRYSKHVCQTCWKTPFCKGLQRYRAHQRQKHGPKVQSPAWPLATAALTMPTRACSRRSSSVVSHRMRAGGIQDQLPYPKLSSRILESKPM